jgi:hypothetical protein
MKHWLAPVLALAAATAPASAQDQGVTAAPATEQVSADRQAFLDACAARKFETIVQVVEDGEKLGKKVTLCGKVGQSDGDWLATLKDAAAKTEANADMAPEVKGQIVTALKLEINRLEAAAATKAVTLPKPIEAAPDVSERTEYSVLPPIPDASRRAAATPAREPVKLSARAASEPPLPPVRKPRLTIKCLMPGEAGGGTICAALERDTLIMVRADEDLASSASLRFLRRGDAKGVVELAQLRQGQMVRSKLPAQLCAGVASSKVQIEVLAGGGQVVDRLGPYRLHC